MSMIRIALPSLRTTLISASMATTMMAMTGCQKSSCEVVIVNESSCVAMAQGYEVAVSNQVNLAAAGQPGPETWELHINDVDFAVLPNRTFDPVEHTLRYETRSPQSVVQKLSCSAGVERCVAEVVAALPASCRAR